MNQETKNYETERKILDSGNRRQFESGAVRDIAEGKGRFDLLPLDTVADYILSKHEEPSLGDATYKFARLICGINWFLRAGDVKNIYNVINDFSDIVGYESDIRMFIELSKHYEEGAKKYDERNWEKGIPAHCFVDSGLRHLFKWYDKWEDEPHDRAFIWNMFGLLWTIEHHPELNDLPYAKDKVREDSAYDVPKI